MSATSSFQAKLFLDRSHQRLRWGMSNAEVKTQGRSAAVLHFDATHQEHVDRLAVARQRQDQPGVALELAVRNSVQQLVMRLARRQRVEIGSPDGVALLGQRVLVQG